MKRFFSIIIVLGLVLALAGCKSDKPVPEPGPDQNRNPESVSLKALSYCGEGSTELLNRVMTIYPVNDAKAVIQFSCYDATDDVDMPVETIYPFAFMRDGDSGYIHTETDQNGDAVNIKATVGDEGKITVTSDAIFPYDISGLYLPGDDAAEIAPITLVEYLRNIPGAEVGDFGLYNPYDETEETLISDWLHDLTLLREGEILGRFLVADDLSVACKLETRSGQSDMSDADDLECRILAGSFESTLDHEATYDIYNADEDTYEEYTQPIVFPYVTGGAVLMVGANESIEVSAPWELTESMECHSSDENIVTAADGSVIAKAPGEATLSVTLHYGGAEKNYELAVQVIEADDETMNTVVEYIDESEQ